MTGLDNIERSRNVAYGWKRLTRHFYNFDMSPLKVTPQSIFLSPKIDV